MGQRSRCVISQVDLSRKGVLVRIKTYREIPGMQRFGFAMESESSVRFSSVRFSSVSVGVHCSPQGRLSSVFVLNGRVLLGSRVFLFSFVWVQAPVF